MDISTVLGFIVGTVFIAMGLTGGEGGIRAFWDLNSIYITVGGALAAVMICFPFSQLKEAPRAVLVAFRPNKWDPLRVIAQMVDLAEKARREGLLALEESLADTQDEFLKRGVQLIVDGTDPEIVRDILETDLNYMEDRHKSVKAVFDGVTTYAPAFGMIGTLIGLVQMLQALESPSTIGPAMAVALVTTFYGAVIANFITGPIANKLAIRNEEEIKLREMMLEGILSIQSGENPRIVEEKLRGFLAPRQRQAAEEQAEERKAGSRGRAGGGVTA